ncbi:MAG: condensation domain-containing protein, partial [Actinomycetota bacterium]|nr:condensation domain-containing protein [Actinomycetota bacterium]
MSTSVEPITTAPLSYGQEQLWFLDHLTPGATTYNILLAARLRGPLDAGLLARALSLVVARHEAMRTTIRTGANGTPFQQVSPPSEVELPVLDGSGRSDREQIDSLLSELSTEPFDLENGPLYRYRLLRLGEQDHVFVQNLHHIVTDGWSSGVVNAELARAYAALADGREPEFDGPGSRYTQYAAVQREAMQGETLDEELSFWADRLAGLPTLEFPSDRPRPVVPTRPASSVIHEFPGELLATARDLARTHNASLFMVFAAALNVVLSRYTGQEDIPVGVPMLGRVDPDLESVVGLFVNMVVLRTDVSGDPSYADLLGRVMDTSLDL